MATNFKIRNKAPAATNKWYIKTTKGGYNKAIAINKTTGYVLPNCCGLVHGRFLECVDDKDYSHDKLCLGNACSYYGYKDGYARSATPKVGAIGCYKSKDGKGAGHVIFVESVKADDSITYSSSEYGGTKYRYGTMKKPYKYSDKLVFQGFILNPLIKEVADKTDTDVPKYKYKVGDKVQIIKAGNGNCLGTGHTAGGIGWKRKIIKIVSGAKYPYCVGVAGIATGWYQEDALKKY